MRPCAPVEPTTGSMISQFSTLASIGDAAADDLGPNGMEGLRIVHGTVAIPEIRGLLESVELLRDGVALFLTYCASYRYGYRT